MTSLKDFRESVGYPQQDNNAAGKFLLTGGLNIETPEALGNPGELIYCSNYEPNYDGGYRSKGGLEPVDGSVQPSAFVYQAVTGVITDPTHLPTVGQLVRIGSFPGPVAIYLGNQYYNNVLYFVFTCCLSQLMTSYYTNAFAASDPYFRGSIGGGVTLYNGANPFGTTSAAGGITFADVDLSQQYIAAARNAVRASILPVGGASSSGPALGVADWRGWLIGVRNNSGGTAAELWAATTNTSWVKINLGVIVYFTANTVQLNVGDTLTGATSGATATISNIVNMFGTVGGGDASGYISALGNANSGNFTAGEVLKVGATPVAKAPASGNIKVVNTLPAGGSYRFRRWNFTGVANNVRLYGVNGIGPAFELSKITVSGSIFVCFTPLITGIGLTAATFNATPPANEDPNFIAAWQDQLFLFYPDGNMQHSGYQTPTNWTAVQGADDRTLGEGVTNVVEDVNNAMIVTTRNRVRMLYGDVNENFQLRDLATTFGAYPNTAQRINGTTMLTDEGVQFYDQAVQFGNFAGSTLSKPINSLLRSLLSTGAGVLESFVSRDRNLYRLMFDNGIGLSFCIADGKCAGIGMINYGQKLHNFWSMPSTIPINDNVINSLPVPIPGEKIYCCGDDGFVYQDEIGGTFGALGNPISFSAQTQFYYGDQIDVDKEKRYRRVRLDIVGADAFTNLSVGAEYASGYGYRTPEVQETVTRSLSASFFDQNSLYGIGFYGGAGKNNIRKELHNSGAALSVLFSGSSSVAFPHTLQAIKVEYATENRTGWR